MILYGNIIISNRKLSYEDTFQIYMNELQYYLELTKICDV